MGVVIGSKLQVAGKIREHAAALATNPPAAVAESLDELAAALAAEPRALTDFDGPFETRVIVCQSTQARVDIRYPAESSAELVDRLVTLVQGAVDQVDAPASTPVPPAFTPTPEPPAE